jgi:NhaP-type Na+/H+ or K+/H+ antiporter
MVGRLCGTLGLIGLVKCICKADFKVSIGELVFIWYAGMIRGAIAFGLVLRINSNASPNKHVIVTTALMLVVFTTVVFGSTVGLL